MIVIGLTGGIASGKSTVSNRLKTYYGSQVIDADAIVYEFSHPGRPIWQNFVARYGKERALLPDGELNRAAIGQLVFSQPAERRWVDSMAHPLIQQEIAARIERCRAAGEKVIVLDVPLLFESGWDAMTDAVWVVYVDAAVQLRRLVERNRMPEALARQRIASQMPLLEKRQRADVVIDNNGTLAETIRQVDHAWESVAR